MSTTRPSYPPPQPGQGSAPPQQGQGAVQWRQPPPAQWQQPPPQQQPLPPWQATSPQQQVQPWASGSAAVDAKPSAYWPLSIISLFMSLLVGAIAMYFSSQVDQRWSRGDVVGARSASQTAKLVGTVGIVIGSLIILLALLG